MVVVMVAVMLPVQALESHQHPIAGSGPQEVCVRCVAVLVMLEFCSAWAACCLAEKQFQTISQQLATCIAQTAASAARGSSTLL